MEYKDPGRYIPNIYLLYSWGSLFGVPSRVPLKKASSDRLTGWQWRRSFVILWLLRIGGLIGV